MRGDDVLYSGGGRGDRLFGGKGKDQFWIDVAPGAQVKVMDFSNQDKLIFEMIDSGLTSKMNSKSTIISFNDKPFLRLENFFDFSFERHALVGELEDI